MPVYPTRIADVLDGAYPGTKADRVMIRTFSWWDRTQPRRIVENARPIKIRDGVLYLHTPSAAWAQELSFHKEDLLRSIQRVVPSIQDLRVKVGFMPPPPPPVDPPPPKTQPLPATQLPGDVARALARVGDDELREMLTHAACLSLAPRTDKRRGRR